MKEKKPTAFSWPLLFIVTSISFLAFSGFVKLIHGSPDHIALFFKIGIISLGAACLGSLSAKLAVKESSDPSSPDKG